MSQTSYAINIPAVSFPGAPADNGFKDILSAVAVAAALPYGILAVGDSTNTVGFDQLASRAPAASSDITAGNLLGVVVADQARAQNPGVSSAQYPQFAAVPHMRKGRIWVYAETAMADGSLPYIRFAAGAGGTVPGSFRNSADTATAAQPPAGSMIVRGTTTAAGYCCIELDIV